MQKLLTALEIFQLKQKRNERERDKIKKALYVTKLYISKFAYVVGIMQYSFAN